MVRNRRARRLALQALSCLDVRGESAWQVVADFIADSHEPAETVAAAQKLLQETFAEKAECDALLVRHAQHWQLGRLALVDRNILRLAVQELRTGRTPFKVVITEALKLAEEFSTADSPRFINGVLDSVAKEIQQG